MRRTFLIAAVFVLPSLIACGHELSDSLGGQSTQGGGDGGDGARAGHSGSSSGTTNDDGGPIVGDDGGGPCVGAAPQLSCDEACGGSVWVTAICRDDGTWGCPVVNSPPCPSPFDAGPDACAEDPWTACDVPHCPGISNISSCFEGQWSCEWGGYCSPEDAGPPPPPPPPPTYFSCGDLACNPGSTYCQITTGSTVAPDGGASSEYACNNLPLSCLSADAGSCDCVLGAQELAPSCGCLQSGIDVIVTCAQ